MLVSPPTSGWQIKPASTLPDPNDNKDQLTIGVGGAYVPDYTGSSHYRLTPAAVIRGRRH